MLLISLVGIGGMVGAVSRYLIGNWVHDSLGTSWFPYGTLTVNVVGCLLIGLLAGLADTRQLLSAEARALLMVGVLGGFTTFSAFGYETMTLVRDGNAAAGITNVAVSVVAGLAAVWIGYSVSQLT